MMIMPGHRVWCAAPLEVSLGACESPLKELGILNFPTGHAPCPMVLSQWWKFMKMCQGVQQISHPQDNL